ncbi:MAG: TIGR01777 family oxidoreductase [Gammaproteobacteria bacterium]|nr:TIGR01777 family oxidoreductase [Gammaproteobacteria bacterium]MBU1554854.1 TIGR01777 family oxidoreductase [Gammaproteobacteria bacterium]MBU2071805.1 TIGR01777 family oxidoreductase [Gammaproteobacteria bacterium]MBU2184127.1 TIGR01777 family oxidoreductase [Gammaproteobacteria bacterium]MBU2204280.1 TIGR01777 family oxidoreductase [Gammaproteobacteria bacterium]
MNILLTGGTGLIGSGLTRLWQSQHKLWLLSRHPAKVAAMFGTAVQAISSLDEVDFNQLDAVINLAGEPIVGKRWTEQQKQRLCDSRWHLTEQLVNAIKAAASPPAVLISGSAIGIYGRHQAQLITEDAAHYNPEFSHQLCQRWEDIALAASSDRTRVCILRTGIVLADNGGALTKMLPAFKLGLGGRISHGGQYMSWLHISDMLSIIEFLLLHPTLSGIFNATAPNPVTNAEFSQTLAQVLKRPALLPMPAWLLQLMLGEMADLLLTGQRVLPANLTKAGFSFRYENLQPALSALLD